MVDTERNQSDSSETNMNSNVYICFVVNGVTKAVPAD